MVRVELLNLLVFVGVSVRADKSVASTCRYYRRTGDSARTGDYPVAPPWGKPGARRYSCLLKKKGTSSFWVGHRVIPARAMQVF